jgi:acetyl esterase
MTVHPDIQKVLDARGVRRLSTMTVEEARASHFEGATAGPPGPDMAEISDERIADVRVRLYRPSGATGAAIVYFHGGGWVLGSIETHDRQCRQLAHGSGATVFNVDYRRAPDHPFPAAYDDAFAVTRQVLEGGASLGVDSTRVGLAGDSAGGNLAAAVALACRSSAGPDILAQLLVYPAVDAEMTSASYDENADGPFLSKNEMVWFYGHYQMDHDVHDWRLSPIHADDLSGLPPALVVTAELDPLRDEGEAYASALANAGVRATAVRYAGVCHGFFGWAHRAEPSRQLMEQVTHWLRTQL